jgi:hypothetical protein
VNVPPTVPATALRDWEGAWTPQRAVFFLSVVGVGIKRLRADHLAAEDADFVESVLAMVREWLAGLS